MGEHGKKEREEICYSSDVSRRLGIILRKIYRQISQRTPDKDLQLLYTLNSHAWGCMEILDAMQERSPDNEPPISRFRALQGCHALVSQLQKEITLAHQGEPEETPPEGSVFLPAYQEFRDLKDDLNFSMDKALPKRCAGRG